MADTINDLYLKYVNKVGETLEADRYFQYLFEMVQAGETTFQQYHQVLHKVVDERWLTVIEDSLDALNRITEKPRRFVTSSEEVVPVALARKITADSVRHLSMNTQFITSSKNGDIQPTHVLNVTTEETYDLYENRFVYALIQRLMAFIDKRTDVIFWQTGDETRNTLSMHSTVDDAYEQIEYKLEMTIKNRQSFAENDSDNMQVFMRIDRVRRMVMSLRDGAFCQLMAGCSRVTSPIQRTNLIMKDPDYRTCLKLWQFLESYEEVGYSIDARDTALEFDEEYVLQMYSNLVTNYTIFKSLLETDPRRLDEIPPEHRKLVKPRFIKQVQEQIVDSCDLPDVEIRKVFVEEVTQAQLDAEEKLRQETALREAAEAARNEAQQQLDDLRWQMQLQLQAQEELAQAEREQLQSQLIAVREQSETAIAKAKAAAQAEYDKLQADLAATRAEAEETLARERAVAQAEHDKLLADLAAARAEAEENLARERATLEQSRADAKARETQLLNDMNAERQRYESNQVRRREITAALKRTEIALQSARDALDQACRERDEALRSAQEAQLRADHEAALRAEAEQKAAEGGRTRRFLPRRRKEQ